MDFSKLRTNLKNLKDSGNVKSIKTFEKNVLPGDIFVCLAGARSDGHDYAHLALARGARFVITQKDLGLGESQIYVQDTRKAYAILCSEWFGNPATQLKLIAVTGTNGKTSTAFVVKQLLSRLTKAPVGLIGTIQNEIGAQTFLAKYTTPEPFELHGLLEQMRKAGCKYVVMEASSHALAQQRLFGLNFLVAGFTNLTQDHLDYHETLENYFLAKCALFENTKTAVVNIDDEYGQRIVAKQWVLKYDSLLTTSGSAGGRLYFGALDLPGVAEESEKTTYHSNPRFGKSHCPISCKEKIADLCASDLKLFADRVEFEVTFKGRSYGCSFEMPGEFSVSNATLAMGMMISLGFNPKEIADNLSYCGRVPGRAEVLYSSKSLTVIRDYAHGPDGLENILKTLRKFACHRLVLLFGCAGERDRTKRPQMGEIAGKYSDFVVITSDNPREEPELEIIADAEKGIKRTNIPYCVIADRLKAIEWVIRHKKPGDLVLLAGKGHENYQALKNCTILFDEKEIVLRVLGSST